jgi:hypothetical protein
VSEPPPVTDEQRQATLSEHRRNNQVECKCGRLISDEGLQLFGFMVDEVVIPGVSTKQPIGLFVVETFCSQTCRGYIDACANGMEFDVQYHPQQPPLKGRVLPDGYRRLPPITWIEKSA